MIHGSTWEPTWAEFWKTVRSANREARRYGFPRAYAFVLLFFVMQLFASILKVAIDISATAVDHLAAIRRITGLLEPLLLIVFLASDLDHRNDRVLHPVGPEQCRRQNH